MIRYYSTLLLAVTMVVMFIVCVCAHACVCVCLGGEYTRVLTDGMLSLGVNIVCGVNCVWLHQKRYIKLMLKKFRLMDAKTVSTPADYSVKLVKDDTVSKTTG